MPRTRQGRAVACPNAPPSDYRPSVRTAPVTEDLHLRALRLLQDDPSLSQRALAHALGISLGRTNYCLRALIDQGWVKVQNFRGNQNKLAYLYLLTPQGIEAKARITARFLKRKEAEYSALAAEIASLRAEVQAQTDPAAD